MRGMVLVLAATAGLVSMAGDLRPPLLLENTQVLPAGVRNPRFIQGFMSVSSRYGDHGATEPLGERLNKNVTWQDVIDAQADEAQKNVVRSVLADNDLSVDGSPGRATGVVHSWVDVKVPILAVGITARLTAAVIVPILSARISVDTAFERSDQGQKFVDSLGEISPDKATEAAAKLNDATQQKLARLRYVPARPETFSGIGDVQLMAKYAWISRVEEGLAGKLVLTLPTGRGPDPDRALDVPLGDSRYKVGAMLIYSRDLAGSLRSTSHAGYTVMLPHSLQRRLPASATDSLSADGITVDRQWGENATFGTAFEWRLDSAGLGLTGAYVFQYQGRSRYSGPSLDPAGQLRMSYLEALEPGQQLHSLSAAVGFSTVDWYRAGRFALPLQANVVYSQPVAGKSVPSAGALAGEIVMFF